jgi:hypothetical protein
VALRAVEEADVDIAAPRGMETAERQLARNFPLARDLPIRRGTLLRSLGSMNIFYIIGVVVVVAVVLRLLGLY